MGIALILSLRSLILALFEQKKWSGRFLDIGLCAFYSLLALILFSHSAMTCNFSLTLGIGVAIGISLILRLFGVLKPTRIVKGVKFLFLSLFGIVSLLSIICGGFTSLNEDKPLVKVTMSGKRVKKLVTWKNPEEPLKQEWLETAEVILETADHHSLGHYYLYGDLVGIRAKVIRFSPLLRFLGVSNLCRIESIYTGYSTSERHNRLPHEGHSIPFSSHFYTACWEKLFYLSWKLPGIKSATLESNYLPLVDQKHAPLPRSYFLILTSGGLSSIPASES